MSTHKIVILGWFGNGNLGDEIILECMLSDFRKADPGVSFVVVSDDPEDTERRHGVRSVSRGGTLAKRLRRLREIITADLFVLGGGAILGSYGGSDRSVLSWLHPLHLAHELGLPTMTLAVGVSEGLSAQGAQILRETLSEVDSICVRDNQSVDALQAMGIRERVTLTADPALVFAESRSVQRTPAGHRPPRVSVFLRHWYVSEDRIPDEPKWAGFKKSLAGCLDSLVSERSAEVTFVPMRVRDPVDDDRAVAMEVSAAMTKGHSVSVVDQEVDSSELLRIISESDLVIGMRLHSLIVAASLGVPVVAIDYHPKVRGFMESIGASDWVLEIEGAGAEGTRRMIEGALSEAYPTKEVLAEVVRLKALGHLNTEVGLELLQDASKRTSRVRRLLRAARILLSRTTDGR